MRRLGWAILIGGVIGSVAALGLSAGSAELAEAGPPREGFSPDPPPKANKKHWVFEVRAEKGVVSLGKVTEVELPKEEATARVMGRYALELYVGKELLDRIRFNVPLGADGPPEPEHPGMKRPEFKVTTKFFVRMADHPRATQLRLVDRATGEVRTFDWPVGSAGLREIGADAGAGPEDGGKRDGGRSDAGPGTDGGRPDGGRDDAGPSDAGAPDAYDPLEP